DRVHLYDLALGLAHDKDAATRAGADKAFLFEQGHRLADRRAAHPEPLREPPLVEPDLLRVVVNVHRGDRPLQRGIGEVAEAGAGVQPRHVDRRTEARSGVSTDFRYLAYQRSRQAASRLLHHTMVLL